jgi:hypothetical protein
MDPRHIQSQGRWGSVFLLSPALRPLLDVKNAIHFLFISEGAARLVRKEVGCVKEMEQGD